jgi:putative ABC transport system permease protein
MLKNYFKIAWRNLLGNRASSIINISGLAVGMAVAILIGLWMQDELSFNKSFKNYDKIAQVLQNQTFNGEIQTWWSEAKQLAPELRNSYGQNFKYVVTASWTGNHLLTYGEKKLTQSGNFMEPDITEMLSLKMLKGTRKGLSAPNSIMLSESSAKAIFGKTDPMDKIVKIDNKYDVKVSGVYEDLPNNTSFADLSFISPFAILEKGFPKWLGWGNSWFQTIAQIADNVQMEKVSTGIKNAKFDKVDDDRRFKPVIFLHPMSRWHLFSDYRGGKNVGGSIDYVWLFGIIGIFVLLLACINFMNLSTARSEKRAKEVGIRKAIGSMRKQLIIQFLSESLLVAGFSFFLSLVLVTLSLPFFNEVAGKKIAILWWSPQFWLIGLGFTLVTGIIAGSYPAFYLSSFQPIKVLKGTFKVGRFASIPRKVLVVVQFTVSATLIIGTIIIFQQIQFAKNRPIGYNRTNLIMVPIKTDEIMKHYEDFRTAIINTGEVEEMAASDAPVTSTYITNSGFNWTGKDPAMSEEFVTLRVSSEFGKMIGWQIKEGRDFSKDFPTDSAGFILNESAVKYMGLKNPIGAVVRWGLDKDGQDFKVIGVVKDLVTQSPYSPVKQMIFVMNYKQASMINIKINPRKSASQAINKIAAVYKTYDPANPFEYKFADEEIARKFGDEERIGKLSSFFALLAIFISCLGLFGLASYVAEQRTKEIGIRKILGATLLNLWSLLSTDFIVLVVISLLIATPTAYYFMHRWLQNYQYRTEISWWVFASAGLGALVITLLTVSFQAIKAALANPVKNLRTE